MLIHTYAYKYMYSNSGWAHTLTNSSEQSSKRKRALLNDKGKQGSSGGRKEHNAYVDEGEGEEENDVEGQGHSVPKMNERVPKPTNLGPLELSDIGKQIKRIFDYGRVCYLRKVGFDAHVVKYCSPELSPECYAILASHPYP